VLQEVSEEESKNKHWKIEDCVEIVLKVPLSISKVGKTLRVVNWELERDEPQGKRRPTDIYHGGEFQDLEKCCKEMCPLNKCMAAREFVSVQANRCHRNQKVCEDKGAAQYAAIHAVPSIQKFPFLAYSSPEAVCFRL
jgi:hypothetical protein